MTNSDHYDWMRLLSNTIQSLDRSPLKIDYNPSADDSNQKRVTSSRQGY